MIFMKNKTEKVQSKTARQVCDRENIIHGVPEEGQKQKKLPVYDTYIF